MLMVLPRALQGHMMLVGVMKVGAIPMPGTILLTVTDYAYSINRAELESE